MPWVVEVNVPNLAENEEVYVPNLGLFLNGQSRQLSDEDVQFFESMSTRTEEVYSDDGDLLATHVINMPFDELADRLPPGFTVYNTEQSQKTSADANAAAIPNDGVKVDEHASVEQLPKPPRQRRGE